MAGQIDTTQGWRQVVLGELLAFANGKTSPRRSTESKYPVYGSNGIIGFSGSRNAARCTIVIGRVGSYCGSLQFSDSDCWVTDNAIIAKANRNADAKFVFYLLHNLHLNDWKTGSGQPLLNQTILSSIPARVPPLPEQRTIAHILGTLDDKIDLNRRMNQTLEAMARAIFEDWFVDFGPVRAKLEGQDPYLPQELWDLFPDRLVCSELGEIPEGWEVRVLSDCIDLARGLSYKGSGLASTGIPMHNLNSIYEGGGYKEDGIKYYNCNFQPRHVTQPGDVLVANTEQGHDRLLIGFAAIVPKRFGDHGLFSHHLYRVRPKRSASLSPDFVCHLLNGQAMHETVSGYATGTTVNMLPLDALSLPRFVAPSAELMNRLSLMVKSARIRQEQLIGESQLLAAQRDALLPGLVSGEVGVGGIDVE